MLMLNANDAAVRSTFALQLEHSVEFTPYPSLYRVWTDDVAEEARAAELAASFEVAAAELAASLLVADNAEEK